MGSPSFSLFLGFLRVTNGELFLCARTTCQQYFNSDLARPLQCEPWKLAAYQKCFLCAIGMSGISHNDTIELGNIYFFAVVQCSRHNLLCSGSNTVILNIRLQTMMVLFFPPSIGFELWESLSGSCCFHKDLINLWEIYCLTSFPVDGRLISIKLMLTYLQLFETEL